MLHTRLKSEVQPHDTNLWHSVACVAEQLTKWIGESFRIKGLQLFKFGSPDLGGCVSKIH